MARIIDRETYEARLAAGLVCAKHPTYKGLRKPRRQCHKCWDIYNARVESGTKERRVRENGRTQKYNDGLTVNGLADNQMHVVSSRVEENNSLHPVFGLITDKLTVENFEKHVQGEAEWHPKKHPGETYAQKREAEGRE